MPQLFKKSWFQVLILGMVIGAVMIYLDNTYGFFASNKSNRTEKFRGVVEADTDKMFFTKAQFSETKFDFGRVQEGDTVVHQFAIKNTGNEPLMVFKAKGSCECILAKHPETPIMPDATGIISVYFKTIGRKGRQLRTVSVETNTDPSETELTLSGDVE